MKPKYESLIINEEEPFRKDSGGLTEVRMREADSFLAKYLGRQEQDTPDRRPDPLELDPRYWREKVPTRSVDPRHSQFMHYLQKAGRYVRTADVLREYERIFPEAQEEAEKSPAAQLLSEAETLRHLQERQKRKKDPFGFEEKKANIEEIFLSNNIIREKF
ncbi:MAG: hypothetical protein HY514_00050 [Candidatus Aenigmarchaeota archaeon]|nr:hypothetical protein [Candidatus Aenigmarchaeota archaeon]